MFLFIAKIKFWNIHIESVKLNRLIALLLFCLSLLPRVFSLGNTLTNDEAYHWHQRSMTFLNAISNTHFADTLLTSHPGVTTMWLGSIGLLLERTMLDVGVISPATSQWMRDEQTSRLMSAIDIHAPADYEIHLSLLRLPLASTTALSIVISYFLLQRVTNLNVALIAAFLWATDPFLIAHSRVLHVDAVLTMLLLLATLTLLAAFFNAGEPINRPYLPLVIMAGGTTGLAFLTKVPAVLIIPIAMIVFGNWLWQQRYVLTTDQMRYIGFVAIVWGGTVLITFFALWPALWVAPWQTMSDMLTGAAGDGGEPHKFNFLLGKAFENEDPGILFYPVNLVGRTTPWTAIGLICVIVALIQRRSRLSSIRGPLLMLFFASLLIIFALTFIPKKFDRYALPAVPLFHILAAGGLYWLIGQLKNRLRTISVFIIVIAASVTLLIYHPYYLSYYSPLIGGGKNAANVVLVGWGEGLDLAADWLNAQPNIIEGAVAVWPHVTIQPYLHTDTTGQSNVLSSETNYLVVYVTQVQASFEDQHFGKFYRQCQPTHIVRIHGIDYAWIYEVDPPQRSGPIDVTFGDIVDLESYEVIQPDVCTCSPLSLVLKLHPLVHPKRQVFLFIHLTNSAGEVVSQHDLPLDGIVPDDAWSNNRELSYVVEIPIPQDILPSIYKLSLGLYYPDTGTRLPLHINDDTNAALLANLDSPESLRLATLDLTRFVANCLSKTEMD
jgi:4-amino-4-deoxy-L-arabinose transferase-like glycosyltransferase